MPQEEITSGIQATRRERPIIMSGDNPKLILEGRKTQTRRIIKPQPDPTGTGYKTMRFYDTANSVKDIWRLCPYGVAGDQLWVKETWAVQSFAVCCESATPNYPEKNSDIELGPTWHPVIHRAGKENFAWGMMGEPKWKSPRFMPRCASRITLEITKVRVERLQDISDVDCVAEGMPEFEHPLNKINSVGAYAALWDSLHGKGAWDKNPWVWVLEFRCLSPKESSTATLTTKEKKKEVLS